MSLRFGGYNFEAYPQFEMTIDGFTCLTGEGNLGKSAIGIRAIRALLLNDFPLARIRKGAKESVLWCEFEGERHDVRRIERKKSAKANSYEITMQDGSVRHYGKAGVEIPKELEEIGFSFVQTDQGEKYDLTVQDQFGPPLFLLQMGEAPLAAFLHKVFRLDGDENALRRMNADSMTLRKSYDARNKLIVSTGVQRGKADSTLEDVEARQASLEAALSAAEAADARLGHLAAAAAALRRIEALRVALAQEEGRRLSVQVAAASVARITAAVARAVRLQSLLHAWASEEAAVRQAELNHSDLGRMRPAVEAVMHSLIRQQRMQTLRRNWTRAQDEQSAAAIAAGRLSRALPPLQSLVSCLRDVHHKAAASQRWRTTERALEQTLARARWTAQIAAGVEAVRTGTDRHLRLRVQVQALAMSRRTFDKVQAHAAVLHAGHAAVTRLTSAFAASQRCVEAVTHMRRAQTALAAAEARSGDVQVSIQDLKARDAHLVNLLGRCPTCHGALSSTHLHEEAHAA